MSRNRPIVLLLALTVGSSPLAAQASPYAGAPVAVPFTPGPRGHIVLDVAVNGGRRVPFVLDTGAGRTILNRARLDSLGLVEQTSTDSVQGAHGRAALGLVDIRSLALGGVTLGAMEVGTMDLTHVESPDMPVFGVLGYDVLSRFDLLLDLTQGTVALHPPARSPASCTVCAGGISVPFELVRGAIIGFDVTISGQSIATVLDTGSGRSGMNSLAARAIGVDLPPSPPGAHGPALQIGAVELGGDVLARNLVVGVVDLPAFGTLGMADGPAMLLGTGALAGRRVGIAYGVQRLSVE